MKKLLVAVALVASVTSLYAEKVRLGTAVVAGRASLTQAVNKIGELSCNAMLAGFAQGALAEVNEKPAVYALTVDGETPDFAKVENPKKKPKLGKDVVAKLTVNGKAFDKFLKSQKDYASVPAEVREILAEFASLTVLARVNNKGISFDGTVKMVEGSKVAQKYPAGKLPKDALAFAAKNCLGAAAFAENAGSDLSLLKKLVQLVEKQGVKLEGLKVEGEANDAMITLDLPQLVKTCEALEKAKASFTNEAFLASVTNLQQKALGTPAGKFSLALKGYEGAFTPAERFAATLPEVANKPLCSMSVGSYYSIAKAVAPVVIAQTDGLKDDPQLQILLVGLPPEAKGAVAQAVWMKDPTTYEFVSRISADEIRSFGMASSSVMAYAMASMKKGASDGADADDDVDDTSDEKSNDED